MALISSLANKKVLVVVSEYGQHRQLRGTLVSYEKPFIELLISGITRIFNENAVKEIVET